MRNVLLVAFFVRPRKVVGANRIAQLRKYLPRFGWNVTTLTAKFDEPVEDDGIVQTPYVDVAKAVKRLVGIGARSTYEALGTTEAPFGTRRTIRQRAVALGYALTTYPDPEVGWFAGGRKHIASMLATNRFDAVISSSPPFITNLMLASLRLRVPWIADFRDLWGDAGYHRSRLQRQLDVTLDRWTLRRASAATAISEPMAEIIRSRVPGLHVETITNAFDPDEWEAVPLRRASECTFVYTGQLFGGHRDPRPLFRAVRRLLDVRAIDSSEIRIDFYASIEPWLRNSVASHGLSDVVRLHGVVPRDQAMRAQRCADRLLIFLFDSPTSHVILTGKLFEYLGARRLILAVGGGAESALDPLFAHTAAGVRCRDDATLEREILKAVQEWRSNNERVIEASALSRYEARSTARQFALLLDRVVDAKDIPRPAT